MYSKRDNRKSLKFKIKIALIFVVSFSGLLIIFMIPHWIPSHKTTEQSNDIVLNTYYTVTPRSDVIGLEVLYDELLIGTGVRADIIYGIGVDLLLERLELYDLTLESDSMLYFINANQVPMKNITGFVMYYTDTPLYSGLEILGLDGSNINFEAVEAAGIQVTTI